jgi:hypothetical protein
MLTFGSLIPFNSINAVNKTSIFDDMILYIDSGLKIIYVYVRFLLRFR